MSRLAPVALALLVAPVARAATVEVSPQAFSPAAGRTLAAASFQIDLTAPRLERLSASNGGRPFAGDSPLLTTISPNGDGLRDRAAISFTLSEPGTVTLDVSRTVREPKTVFSRTRWFRAGRHTLYWQPAAGLGPRTYLVRLTAADAAGNRRTYGSQTPFVGRYPRAPVVRLQGIDAAFTRPSYAPGQLAFLRISTDAPSLTLQTFRAGPETVPTYPDNVMNGVATSKPRKVGWLARRDAPEKIRFRIGAWPTGVYYVQLTAPDGRIGYAPFVVRPPFFGQNRVAIVIPTNTWQAYNFYDENGDGWGDTWYAGPPHQTVRLGRPFLRRGVPPFFRRYDLGFLHWLAWSGRSVDYLSDSDLAYVPTGDDLARVYDLVVFPGHSEYEPERTFALIERYRDLGGNLMFLSANNFFWRVQKRGQVLHRAGQFRQAVLPEATVLGVQYRANDRGEHQGAFVIRNAAAAPWLWDGTGLTDGSLLGNSTGGYGIEIDATTPESPPGTVVVADIPDLFGPGVTAQMAYYETPAGAKVFAAGALDFGGSATDWPVRRVLENLWARLSVP